MLILQKGLPCTCKKCASSFEANETADFNAILCNGEYEFFVVCPICGENLKIGENDIPRHIRPYIKPQRIGWAHLD